MTNLTFINTLKKYKDYKVCFNLYESINSVKVYNICNVVDIGYSDKIIMLDGNNDQQSITANALLMNFANISDGYDDFNIHFSIIEHTDQQPLLYRFFENLYIDDISCSEQIICFSGNEY